MYSLYWIQEALAGILPTLWMFVGLGLPWALALLPTKQWQSRAMIAGIALAVGPGLMTAWMLILGVMGAQINQSLLRPEWILSGSLVLCVVGCLIAWRKRKSAIQKSSHSTPFAVDEKLIITLMVIAIVIRWIHTAFWTFTAYDALWVYGFQGRLYTLKGMIPHSIDYYPQFVQLQYAYVQILIGGINDYAARMVIPMMHIGSIIGAYLLGERLFGRRVGIFTAALWSLHPYVGQWSFIGDLEIPVTFGFTMASAFFLSAWMEQDDPAVRRQYAILAGLMLGIAMWTKPTAGAFIWGVALLIVVDLLRNRFNIRAWSPRFMVAFWTGLVCIPLGGIWYVRNILLGHEVITLPPALWLTLARRSGDHFNWIVLAIIIGFVIYTLLRRLPLHLIVAGIIGIIFILLGVLPSNPVFSPERYDPPQSYMTIIETVCFIAGLVIIAGVMVWHNRGHLVNQQTRTVRTLAWALLLATPYFVTFFYSYSYHYRLGFAIVPLMILPTAVFLVKWLTVERIQSWSPSFRNVYLAYLLAICIPGVVAVAFDFQWSSLWLTTERLVDDISKYQAFNPALIEVRYKITEYMAESDVEPVIIAPGEQRLHFFFPEIQIIDDPITTFAELEAYGATHFVYGTQAKWAYERAGIIPEDTQLIAGLGRVDRLTQRLNHTDATFSYEVYEHVPNYRRLRQPTSRFFPVVYEQDIMFGDSLRYVAEGIGPEVIYGTQKISLTYAWQAIQPITEDYQFVIDLYNKDRQTVEWQWILYNSPQQYGHYATNLWDVGEYVQDHQLISMTYPDDGVPDGDNYEMRLRIFSPEENRYLPVYIDGKPAGDFFRMAGTFQVRT